MNRRKGVPCGCDADPCGCSPRNHCVKTINNESPDPNGDLVIQAGAGIGIAASDFGITITNTATPENFTEGKNIEFNEVDGNIEIGVIDDPVIDGTLTVNGDIIQNGAAYETHAEKVFTKDDYIVMRDGAVGALAAGDYSGFQVEKYDGVNDGRLVIDNSGVARVGDVGDEQPLLTRSESASLTNAHLLQWDGTNQKAVDAGFSYNDIDDALDTKVNKTQYNLDMAGKVSGSGNIGSDTKPVKVVNGVAVPVSADLQEKITVQTITPTLNSVNNVTVTRVGKIVQINFNNSSFLSVPDGTLMISGIPTVTYGCAYNIIQWYDGTNAGMLLANPGDTGFYKYLPVGISNYYGTITYITNDP